MALVVTAAVIVVVIALFQRVHRPASSTATLYSYQIANSTAFDIAISAC
jgi:hypothetical protein